MIHQVIWSIYSVKCLVHVANLGTGIFIDGVSHSCECPVLIKATARPPVNWIEMDEYFVSQYQAKGWGLREWYQYPSQLPETISGIAAR